MRPPRILLVASGAPSEGRGHLGRTMTIARALVDAGASVSVAVLRGAWTASQAAAFDRDGVTVVDPGALFDHPDAVVLDLPDANELNGRWPADRLVVLDDQDRFDGSAAVVIQPSLPAWTGPGAAGRVLAGTAYAPIRPELRRLAAASPDPANPPEIAICFGGSDPHDVSSRLVPAIAAAVDPGRAAVNAIVGPGYQGALASNPRWGPQRDPVDLDERLARAAIVVIGGGTMKHEVAHLGVPAVIVAVSDDQLPVAPSFAETGAARYLGDGRTLEPAVVGAAVAALLDDAPARAAMAHAGRATVDGRGAERIAAAVLAVAGSG